jgi:hypothetical protein
VIAPSLILLYTHRGHLDKSSDVSLDLAIGYLPVWHFSFSISPSQLPLSKCLCFLHLMHKSLNSARPSLKPRRADQPWLDSQGDKGKARCRCSTPFFSYRGDGGGEHSTKVFRTGNCQQSYCRVIRRSRVFYVRSCTFPRKLCCSRLS